MCKEALNALVDAKLLRVRSDGPCVRDAASSASGQRSCERVIRDRFIADAPRPSGMFHGRGWSLYVERRNNDA
jgi:hypothetical protein